MELKDLKEIFIDVTKDISSGAIIKLITHPIIKWYDKKQEIKEKTIKLNKDLFYLNSWVRSTLKGLEDNNTIYNIVNYKIKDNDLRVPFPLKLNFKDYLDVFDGANKYQKEIITDIYSSAITLIKEDKELRKKINKFFRKMEHTNDPNQYLVKFRKKYLLSMKEYIIQHEIMKTRIELLAYDHIFYGNKEEADKYIKKISQEARDHVENKIKESAIKESALKIKNKLSTYSCNR